jgi:pilus assembly protein CpaB
MNRNRLLLIGVLALALGAFVSYAVYSNLKASTAKDTRPGVDVVVAAEDLQVGTRIADHNMKLVRFPEGTLPPNTIGRMSQIIGRGVILPISKGEFILPNKLAAENAGSGLPSLIPPGMRAVSVRVNEVVSVAGFVVAGTRVDVLLTGNPTNAGEQQTTTVLENVAVIATGHTLERSSSGDPETTPVITLLVSPDDAQKVTLAQAQGRIQLALRNPLDTREQNIPSVNTRGLYPGAPVVASTAPRQKIKRSATMQAPAPPPIYTVEVIQGSKSENQKITDTQ